MVSERLVRMRRELASCRALREVRERPALQVRIPDASRASKIILPLLLPNGLYCEDRVNQSPAGPQWRGVLHMARSLVNPGY